MNKTETITAIATPIGVGGISIIRISGSKAKDIVKKIFICKTSADNFEPRKLYLGKIKAQDVNEQCLCVYFQAPFSYTGEDVVEFQIHGGILITNKVLHLILNNGAKLAEAGEFTKRAFLNGKLSLEKAEAVIDTINATSEMQLKSANNLLNGALSTKLDDMQNQLTQLIAQIEVAIDYPEYDIEYITAEKVKHELIQIANNIDTLIQSNIQGRVINNGINVALVGVPNVGKSSLMNALLEYDRAIVTDIAGTTRDTLNESFNYKGIRINLIDTAGIRDSEDTVEKIGISRSYDAINNSDVVLFLIDNSVITSKDELALLEIIDKNKLIIVKNKSDLANKNDLTCTGTVVEISAKNNTNIEKLKEEIYNKVFTTPLKNNYLYITNQRHKDLLERAYKSIDATITAINNGYSLDLLMIDIQNTWKYIGEITGKNYSNEVLNTIFSKFCLGK